MLTLDIAVVNTALPHMARSLHAGLSGMQWVVDAYTLALAAVVLTAGSLNDRFGRQRSLLVGLGFFTAASVACALSGSVGFLDGARAVRGLGAAGMFASSLAVLADAFRAPAERAGAAVLTVAFLVVQRVRRDPMLPLELFRNPSFTGAQVAALAISGSFLAVFFYVTVYLQAIRHLSPIRAGLVYLPSSALLFVVSAASARLLRRVSLRTMISAGLAVVAAGMALCLLTGTGSSWLALSPGLLVASAGTGLFNPALSAVALGEVPSHQIGLGAGVNDAFRNVGLAVGVAALGALIPAGCAFGGGSPRAFVSGFHHALLACSVLAGVGAVLARVLIRTSPRSTETHAAPAELAGALVLDPAA